MVKGKDLQQPYILQNDSGFLMVGAGMQPRRGNERRTNCRLTMLPSRKRQRVILAVVASASAVSASNERQSSVVHMPRRRAAGHLMKHEEYDKYSGHQKVSDEEGGEVLLPAASTTPHHDAGSDHPNPHLRPQTAFTEDDTNEIGGSGGPDLSATDMRAFSSTSGSGTRLPLPPYTRYPYMASLELKVGGGKVDSHICSGMLIAPDLILTSAHCAHYVPPDSTESVQAFNGIQVGRADLNDDGPEFDPYKLSTYELYYENLIPDTLIIHPEFNDVTYEHDVMLVKVFGKSRFPPVRLSDNELNFRQATALGWGADSSDSKTKFSNLLRTAKLEVMSNDNCMDIIVDVVDPVTKISSTIAMKDHVFNDMLCATTSIDDRYICYGDAGGPVLLHGTDSDSDVVYGILSWGYGCVNPDYPAVMTSISDHYNWIRETICRESSNPPKQYECSPQLTMMSGSTTRRVTVTLKIKLDGMAVETGFVIEHLNTKEIVAQRQVGFYKAAGNDVIKEIMNLPGDGACYRLIMLDSYGDGFCCDMGGGDATLFLGTNTGHLTGHKLVEVSGQFEFDNSGEFCLEGGSSQEVLTSSSSPANTIQAASAEVLPPSHNKDKELSSSTVIQPASSRVPVPDETYPNDQEDAPRPDETYADDQENASLPSKSSWTGSAASSEYDYCTQFCEDSNPGMICGEFECSSPSDEDDANTSDGALMVESAVLVELSDVSSGMDESAISSFESACSEFLNEFASSLPIHDVACEVVAQVASSNGSLTDISAMKTRNIVLGTKLTEEEEVRLANIVETKVTAKVDSVTDPSQVKLTDWLMGVINLQGTLFLDTLIEKGPEYFVDVGQVAASYPKLYPSPDHFTPISEYYVSVLFQFDDNPEEISWVLFDLNVNDAKVFVDYGAYTKEEYANKLLTIPITMDGPELGEKQYVFTVYDKSSNGLCCNFGNGYYKVFLGNVEDDHELLGDGEFEFSSSYYFTLFENQTAVNSTLTSELNEESSMPSDVPTEKPSPAPSPAPSPVPSDEPTDNPTLSPTTGKPTNPWEIVRPDVDVTGSQWSTPRVKVLPGKFNDVGGDPNQFTLQLDRITEKASAASTELPTRRSLMAGLVFVTFILALIT